MLCSDWLMGDSTQCPLVYFSHVKKLYWKLIGHIALFTVLVIKKREFYLEGLLYEIGLIYIIKCSMVFFIIMYIEFNK